MRTPRWPLAIVWALSITTFAVLPQAHSQVAVEPGTLDTPASEPAPQPPSPAAKPTTPAVETPEASTQSSSSIVELNGRAVAETPRRFHYAFQLTVRGAYDDNINLTQTGQQGDFYTSIEPVLSLGVGGAGEDQTNFLNFVYAPNAYIFAKRSEADAIQHIIHLDAQRQFAKLTLGFGEDIQILDSSNLTSLTDTTGRQANVDVGQRTRENIFTTRASGSYDLSSKTFLSGSANYQVYDYPSLLSSETISGTLFINYNYGAKVTFGIGGTAGYDTSEGATPDQYFQQANARLSYQVTGKIGLGATAGIEFRGFANNSRSEYISPVFDLNATYAPFDGTSVSLSGNRTTRNSAVISGSDFASTKIDVGVKQRFFQRVFAGINFGYENDNYFSTVRTIDVSRSDDYYYIQTSVDLDVTRFWTVGAYYLHREDSSSLDAFRFSDNQFGARATLKF